MCVVLFLKHSLNLLTNEWNKIRKGVSLSEVDRLPNTMSTVIAYNGCIYHETAPPNT